MRTLQKKSPWFKVLVLSVWSLFFIGKFEAIGQSQAPEWAWIKTLNGGSVGTGIKKDVFGNIYITGYFGGTVNFGGTSLTSQGIGTDIFLAKYSSTGNLTWVRSATGLQNALGRDLALDEDGNIYVTGWFQQFCTFGDTTIQSNWGQDIFVAKYDTSGNFTWVRSFGGWPNSNEGYRIATDKTGKIWFTGYFSDTCPFGNTILSTIQNRDYFVARMDSDGKVLWAKGGGSSETDFGLGLQIDPFGNGYLTGYFQGQVDFGNFPLESNFGTRDIFITKIDSSGNFLWAKKAGGGSIDETYALSVDNNQNTAITGRFSGTIKFGQDSLTSVGNYDAFIAKYSASGDFLWAKRFGGPGSDRGNNLCFDSEGNIINVGAFTNSASFETNSLTTKGLDDIYIIKLNPDGQLIWFKQVGGPDNENGTNLFFNPTNQTCLVTGSISNGTLFDSTLINSIGSVAFFAQLSTEDTVQNDETTSIVKGSIYQISDSNCVYNSTNKKISRRVIKALPGPYYAMTDNNGDYEIKIQKADSIIQYNLQAIPISGNLYKETVICPPLNQNPISVHPNSDTIKDKNFGFERTPCHHLNVQMASNRRRRCFLNNTSISYTNQGSLSAPGAYILVEFPRWVRPISSTKNHIALNDSVWRFNLDTVSAGESDQFIIVDSVLCGHPEILGLSQCTRATIFPAPDCPPPSGFNDAEVSVSGKCFNGYVDLGIYNKGNADMVDSVDYWIYLDSIQVKQAKVKLAAGDSLKMWVEAFGFSVHLTANQVTNHPTEIFVSTTVDDCSDTIVFYPRPMVNRFPKQQTPNSKTHCLNIQGSYDPNDKQVFPIGFTNQNIIPPNTQLEYLVRFQNTGNDTAFTVYVIDTLDDNLNPESIELGATSHSYQFSMETSKSGKTFLRWQFNHILLPDSNSNQLKSNGFIQYRISPKSGLALGSKAKNHAEIYFDFNPPVLTNQTLTTFDNLIYRDSTLNDNVQFVTHLQGKLSNQQIGVKLYPNPVIDNSLTADFQIKGSLILFNTQGQIVYQRQELPEGKTILPIQLKPGFYMAQMRTEKGISIMKLIVETQ